MKMAIIIQCHNRSDQINHLIEFFNEDWIDLYIHVDFKSDIINEINIKKNVNLVKDRVDVRWGTFSQCEATLKAFKLISETKIRYKYIHLISGEDFPVKSLKYFYDYFSKENCNFIEYSTLPNPDLVKNGMDRFEVYYPQWMIGRSNQIGIRIIRVLYRNFVLSTKLFKRKSIPFKTIYYGSQWFSINYETFQYINEYLEKNEHVINFFKNSIYPDEMFFQTIILNAHNLFENRDYNLRYIDWSDKKGSPKTVDKEDIDLAFNTNALFIRKVQSSRLINYIKSKLG